MRVLDEFVDEDIYLETGVVREDSPHCAVLIESPERSGAPLEEFQVPAHHLHAVGPSEPFCK